MLFTVTIIAYLLRGLTRLMVVPTEYVKFRVKCYLGRLHYPISN